MATPLGRWVSRFALLTIASCLVLIHAMPIFVAMDDRSTGDFGSFYATGYALKHSLPPYSEEAVTHLRNSHHARLAFPNFNPPTWFPLFRIAAEFELFAATHAMRFLSILGFLAGILLLRDPRPAPAVAALVCLSFTGFWATLRLGQAYVILFVILVLARLAWRRERSGHAGFWLGLLVSLKPNFLLCALFLVKHASKRALGFFALGLLGPIFASAALFGTRPFQEWRALLEMPFADFAREWSVSLYSLAHGSEVFSLAALAIVLILAVSVFLRAKKTHAIEALDFGAALTILLSPVSWVGYTLLLLPALLTRLNKPLTAAAAAFLCIPNWQSFSAPQFHRAGILLIAIQLGKELLIRRDAESNHDAPAK